MVNRWQLSRVWHAVIVLVCSVCIVVQLSLVIKGHTVLIEEDGTSAAAPERVLRFFSYFTIQSNILALAMALTLVLTPDRDGRWWRIMRVASIVGMTVTLIVYHVALAPNVDFDGAAKYTDIGFHYVATAMTAVGWLLFGPRPRIDPGSLIRHLIWPLVYIVYVLILGAISGWYPYPFTDVDEHGYPVVLLNAVVVMALLLAIGGAYYWLDKVLGDVPTTQERTASLYE